MSSAPVAALIIVLTLAAVLLTSGIAKLRDARATRDAFDALRVPRLVPLDAAARALPWGEIALAVLLLAAPSGWLVPVAAIVVVLMLAYTWLVARALCFAEPVTCSCFGSLGRHAIDRTTFARNLLLTVLAIAVGGFALDSGSTQSAIAALDGGEWWALVAAAAAAAIAVLVTGGASATQPSRADDAELLDYERQAIPYGVLAPAGGRNATLGELASTQARLLVVLSQGCAPCVRTAEKLNDWSAALEPAVSLLAVYPEDVVDPAHGADLIAIEPERNVRRVFSVGAPGAVLLGADGFIAGGPVAGEGSVERFVEEVLEALRDPEVRPPF